MTQERPPSATKRLVERQHRQPVDVLLRGYHALGWTQGRIAEELGVSRATVNRWFGEYGIRVGGADARHDHPMGTA